MKTEKMAKTAHVFEIILKIVQIFLIVGCIFWLIIMAVFTAAYFMGYQFPIDALSTDFSLGDINIVLNQSTPVITDYKALVIYLWVNSLFGFVLAGVLYYALGIFRKILRPMEHQQPFAPDISTQMTKLAFISLFAGILNNIASNIMEWYTLQIVDISAIFEPGQVQSVSWTIHLDLSFIILFFVFLLLSYVFRYGEQLQKLSDETL